MASDVVLVVGSTQRRLRELVDRCQRPARGLNDPVADLARAAAGQAAAVTAILELGQRQRLVDQDLADWAARVCADLDRDCRRYPVEQDGLIALVDQLLAVEQRLVDAWSKARVDQRRQWGRTYRNVAAGAERSLRAPSSRAAAPSGTELYDRARRANVAHRSRMTVRELQVAVEAAEHRPEAC